jgi:UPF0755 protein
MDILRRLLRTLVSLAMALLLVAALLVGGYLFVIKPSRSSQTPSNTSQASSAGGLRGALVSLLLASKSDQLLPVSADPDAPAVSFEVQAGQTATEVAQALERAGLVRDASAFSLLLRDRGLDRHIEAGHFELSPAMSAEQIAAALAHARGDEVVLVTLEGWRLEQDAIAVQQGFGQGQDFLNIAARQGAQLLPDWVGRPPDSTSLEGFLFPDTYRFAPDAKAVDIIAAMLADFANQFSEDDRAQAQRMGLTPYQVVTLASIVEREAVRPEERPLIAAVFLNRLKQGMRLEADPTVQYALGLQADSGRWWKVPLLAGDIQAAVSPYNTYLNPGLPPGPICSPGKASIDAVLHPANVDYLYFVAKGDGYHAFTASYDEHVQNVQKYQGN